MQVLQLEDDRAARSEPEEDLGGVEGQDPPPPMGIAAGTPIGASPGPSIGFELAPVPGRRGADDPVERGTRGGQVGFRRSGQPTGDVEQDGPLDMAVRGERPAPRHSESCDASAILDGPQQPRLADTGFAGEQEEPALAAADFGDPPVREVQQVVASDKDRAHELPPGHHGCESRPPDRWHIGQMTDVRPARAAHRQGSTATVVVPSRRSRWPSSWMSTIGFFGVTAQQLAEAHQRDLDVERQEGVHYEHAWLDPESGKVFCLATGPSKEAVMRVHEQAGHPTPQVYEVSIEVS